METQLKRITNAQSFSFGRLRNLVAHIAAPSLYSRTSTQVNCLGPYIDRTLRPVTLRAFNVRRVSWTVFGTPSRFRTADLRRVKALLYP